MHTYLGIDWGGTFIKAGVVKSTGTLIKKCVIASPKLREKSLFLNKVKELFKKFNHFSLRGVGIGAPGIIDIPGEFIYYLPNIPGWENYHLGDVLRRELNVPVCIDNDANVFALAEARLGAAKGKKNALFLTLGTGLGGALMVNGSLIKGRTSAGEVGHVPLSIKGKLCSCGGRGCVETYVGGKYLIKRYKALKKKKAAYTRGEVNPVRELRTLSACADGDFFSEGESASRRRRGSPLAAGGKPPSALSGNDQRLKSVAFSNGVKDIFQKASEGEREALIVWKEFSQTLGKFLAGMINVFNPEIIVFGGGVSGAFRLFKPLVWQVIKGQAMWPQIQHVKLVKAKVKDAGIIGAALLVKEQMHTDKFMIHTDK